MTMIAKIDRRPHSVARLPHDADPSSGGLSTSLKRGADFVLALAILALVWPLILLAMAAMRLTSRGPALYWQTRLGLHGRPYTIYKIRTMHRDCERATGA